MKVANKIRFFILLMVVILGVFISVPAYSQTYGSKLCKTNTNFECYRVKANDTWKTLFSNDNERDVVMRINRMNISLHPGMIIAIPKNLYGANKMDFSPFPKQIEAPGKKVVLVSINPSVLAWGAYNANGSLENWGPVSGGRGWCPDINRSCNTSSGKFAIYQKQGAGCKSTKYPVGRGGAPMPYCMFFNGGYALHGSYEVPGYNASHGCVRLFIPDAQWLNENFSNREFVAVIISRQS